VGRDSRIGRDVEEARLMLQRVVRIAVLVLFGFWARVEPYALADEFEQIEGELLAATLRGGDAASHSQLTISAIDALPNVLRDSRSALLIAATDQGNPARLLVAAALRKTPGSAAAPVPVLVVERFETFEAGNLGSRLARGKDLILFDEFQLDLDSGQIVPAGQGGDLQFRAMGEDGPRLVALGSAKLYTLTKSPLRGAGAAVVGRPALGRTVHAGDFAGRYRLFANGQWSGTLDLKVDDAGGVSGRFRSDSSGAAYPVSGHVAADVPHKISFRVKYPRTQQDFEGFLWTEGKGAMAGMLTMLDRAYGFFAVRDGGRIVSEGEDVGSLAGDAVARTPGRRTIVVRKGQYTLDGQPRTDQELTDLLRQAVAAEPATWVLLRVSDDEPFGAIARAFEVIGAAGVRTIRLAGAD
jgi:hypothetical protein